VCGEGADDSVHVEQARLQSLSEGPEDFRKDPRADVVVAGEDGFSEPAAYGGGHPGGSANNLTPAEIEAKEEDASQAQAEGGQVSLSRHCCLP